MKTEKDGGAYLKQEVVEAMAFLKENDVAKYAAFLTEIKDAGGRLGLLKKEIRGYVNRVIDNQYEEIGLVVTEDNKVQLNENIFARYILQYFKFILSKGENFLLYDDGVYRALEPLELSKLIRDFLHQLYPDIWTEGLEGRIVSALKRECPYIEELDCYKRFINIKNGMFDLLKYQLVAHKYDFYSSIRVPIEFNPKAKCPRFNQFLLEVTQYDKELIYVIQEMFGYCLTADIRAQKAFILVGNGANGKSVLLEVLKNLVGKENCSCVPMAELNNSFARYEIVAKTLNFCTENEFNNRTLNTGEFKAIVSGDPIRVEKKYETGFLYSPVCKLVYALNSLPLINDTSFGFFRRLVIIPFTRIFSEKEADKELIDKLLQELPGIFNFAVEGLKRLRENGFIFTKSEACLKALNDFKQDASPIMEFVEKRILASEAGRVENKDIYAAFLSFCRNNNYGDFRNISTRMFWKQLRKVLNELKIPYQQRKSNGVDYYYGVTLKESQDDIKIKLQM